MIIKSLDIKNFRSYYGSGNHIDFSDDLTLIIGGNGDGKTTFFDAIEWLFNTSSNIVESNISEMRKSELEVGEFDSVEVSVVFEHNETENELIKRFYFEKIADRKFKCRDFNYIGYYSSGSERNQIGGAELINRCFDTVIRKYCLFNGESELNVFNNSTALKTLVDTFSDIKQFDELVSLTDGFAQKSMKAFTQESQKDSKIDKQAKELNGRLQYYGQKIFDLKQDIIATTKSINDYTSNIEKINAYHEASEKWHELDKRLDSLKEREMQYKRLIKIDYNTVLLDENWILRSFNPIFSEFVSKISKLDKEKRRLDKLETERRAEEKGKQKAFEELKQDFTPLKWDIPDQSTMEEMLEEKVCKVCGTPAPIGSKAYNFMLAKYNQILETIKAKEAQIKKREEEKELFPKKHIDELHRRLIRMSGDDEKTISELDSLIKDKIGLVQRIKEDLSEVQSEINDLLQEKNDLLLQNPNVSEEFLNKSFSDYRGNFNAKDRAQAKLNNLNQELAKYEAEIRKVQDELNNLAPTNVMVKVYQKVNKVFDTIKNAFSNARNSNVTKFLELLEAKANEYLAKLNVNDFYGNIRIIRTIDDSAKIALVSSNGDTIENPNGALETTMYMSVLFAISNITTLKRNNDYPLIFDAPTSSFEGVKEDVFYNVIDDIEKQCIIVTKDLIVNKGNGKKELNIEKINKLKCSVYSISKAEGFNEKDLSTIRTIIKPIK